MQNNDFLFASNSVFIEEMKKLYSQNKNLVPIEWKNFFENEMNSSDDSDNTKRPKWTKVTPRVVGAEDDFIEQNKSTKKSDNGSDKKHETNQVSNVYKSEYVAAIFDRIISKYRANAHFLSKLDALEIEKLPSKDDLGLDRKSLVQNYENLESDVRGKIDELIQNLDFVYTNKIGVEFEHLDNKAEKDWLYSRFESLSQQNFTRDEKKSFLEFTMKIEDFEQYLHVKFPGAKRFSCEGCETSVLATYYSILESANFSTNSVLIGMAHRGRLATLTNVVGKPYSAIMSEFSGSSAFPKEFDIAGDVKYHMGYQKNMNVKSKTVSVSMLPNPSHLESVNAVLMGRARAEQDSGNSVLPILIHGDASFCGQGVVAETLNMSPLPAYFVSGVVHIVVNNQIGYTANRYDGSFGRYCTEYSKVCNAPIVHVNADSIEDVVKAVKLCVEYRERFKKDVVLDVIGYRKYGHNEGDEPAYTQGFMYDIIRKKLSVQNIYFQDLLKNKLISQEEYDDMRSSFKNILDDEFSKSKEYKPQISLFEGLWNGFKRSENLVNDSKIATGIKSEILVDIAKKISEIPVDFNVHPKLAKVLETRIDNFNENKIDWSMAEALSFGSLLIENIQIRITGQDAGRGTFSHRHSVVHDTKDDKKKYIPLNDISASQANYFVADSCLSEFGVLGFEYGYSCYDPNRLVIWEAQFGDFANGAQTIIDQFISSAETKWLQMSGLVMLLPHGYEGQGPEHSSARLERYLQLAADDNMFVANPTTPASFFHLIRRQIKSSIRKPLIVMTPKSLLRNSLAVSKIEEISGDTKFENIIEDNLLEPKNIKKIIFCSGKIYYDLAEYRSSNNINDTAIIRFEQLYPFDYEKCADLLGKYSNIQDVIWCQEEHMNMGAYSFIKPRIDEALKKCKIKADVRYVGRPDSSSPSTGYLWVHTKEQKKVIESAFSKNDGF